MRVRESRSAQGGGVVAVTVVVVAAAAVGEGGASEELEEAVVSDWVGVGVGRSVSQSVRGNE